MPKPKAQFLGLYEADEDQIYRVLISDCESFGKTHFSITDAQGANASMLVINSPTTESAPFNFELSIRVPRGTSTFALLYRGKPIAHMNKIKAAKLMIRRNVAMVNPEIDERYQKWLQLNPVGIPTPEYGPLISIISPLFNTPVPYLRDMIDSVLGQAYSNWELLLINASPDNAEMKRTLATYSDRRIRVIELKENLGIVGNTNIGIQHTTGDYIAFLDHDDTVDNHLLSAYVNRINSHPDTDLFYCDEDNFQESLDDAYGPRFKPDFNLDLLYSHNYILHCLMVSRHALNQIELSPEYVNGAQDYDLTLKAVEVARSIYHAPYVLYHWRAHAGSTNGGEIAVKPYAIEAGRRALQDHFNRRNVDLSSEVSKIPCVYELLGNTERLIPTSTVIRYETAQNLLSCLETIKQQMHTDEDRVFAIGPQIEKTLLRKQELPLVTVLESTGRNAREVIEDLLCQLNTPITIFCTDEIRFSRADCLTGIAAMAEREEVGTASPKLLYHDGLVAQAGRYVLDNGDSVYINRYFTDHMGGGYHGLAECACSYSAANANCFAVKTNLAKTALNKTRSLDLTQIIDYITVYNHDNNLATVVNPRYKATIQPYINNDSSRIAIPKVPEILFNQNVELSSGYMRLNIEKNDRQDERRQFLGRIRARLLR